MGISSASEVRNGRKGVHTVGGRMPQQCDCEGFGIALPLQTILTRFYATLSSPFTAHADGNLADLRRAGGTENSQVFKGGCRDLRHAASTTRKEVG